MPDGESQMKPISVTVYAVWYILKHSARHRPGLCSQSPHWYQLSFLFTPHIFSEDYAYTQLKELIQESGDQNNDHNQQLQQAQHYWKKIAM